MPTSKTRRVLDAALAALAAYRDSPQRASGAPDSDTSEMSQTSPAEQGPEVVPPDRAPEPTLSHCRVDAPSGWQKCGKYRFVLYTYTGGRVSLEAWPFDRPPVRCYWADEMTPGDLIALADPRGRPTGVIVRRDETQPSWFISVSDVPPRNIPTLRPYEERPYVAQ
jgi:hypothetical protein